MSLVDASIEVSTKILLNLLNNAIQYNCDGGSINVSFFELGDYIKIEIINTGIGIDKNDHEKVFIPFERLGFSGSNDLGAGVGLALVKRLVHSMGGDIAFESDIGEKTTFWFTLPIHANKFDFP